MTTTGDLSGEEVPKRVNVGNEKLSKKRRRKILKNAILSFEKEKKKGNKPKKVTAKDILQKTGQVKEEVDAGSYEMASYLMKKYPKTNSANKIIKKALEDETNDYRKKRIQSQKDQIIEVINFEKKSK